MFIAMIVSVLFVLVVGFVVYKSIKQIGKVTSKDFSYLRWIIPILSIAIFLLSISIVLGSLYHILGFAGIIHEGQNLWNFESSGSLTSTFTVSALGTPFSFFVDLVKNIAMLGLFICVRSFMRNILANDIFDVKNIHLAHWSTYFLLLASLVSKGVVNTGLVSINVGEDYAYSFFNLNYLLAAVLVWTLSLILEKAIAIAEENEFTI